MKGMGGGEGERTGKVRERIKGKNCETGREKRKG